MNARASLTLTLWLAWSPLMAAALQTDEALALLGDGVLLAPIEGPVLTHPGDWVGRPAGRYTFRFTAGDDHGELEQVETHVPDPARPQQAWTRQIGEAMLESVEIVDRSSVRIYAETDLVHGYRVSMDPAITIPAGVRPGDSWTVDSALTVYELGSDSPAYNGRLTATRRYAGAWRVKVPAGEFDAVLLAEHYDIEVGPLSVADTRHVFYARGVGVVAEVEGVRASALIVFRMRDKSAKVLVNYEHETSRGAGQ